MFTFALVKQNNGAIAQLVEQRTENPCVPGSIPGGTTDKERVTKVTLFSFCLLYTSPSPRDLSTSRMPSSA